MAHFHSHLTALIHKRSESAKQILLALVRLDESLVHAATVSEDLCRHIDRPTGFAYKSIFDSAAASAIGKLIASVFGLSESTEGLTDTAPHQPLYESKLIQAISAQHNSILKDLGIGIIHDSKGQREL